VVNLTNTSAIREQDPHWSHDGGTIAFAYKPKEGSQYDIALLDWRTRKVHKLTNEHQPGYSWNVVALSSDDKVIYADRVNPLHRCRRLPHRRSERQGRKPYCPPGHIRYLASSLSPNGETLLVPMPRAVI
jgi:Tol biopolymer transport system component